MIPEVQCYLQDVTNERKIKTLPVVRFPVDEPKLIRFFTYLKSSISYLLKVSVRTNRMIPQQLK
ncbi:hypothetical protein ALQ29_200016 [Pseudomonas marginalis pv. marginalis]|uniref:Uncharacterized protein n=1 Tax=Pseudomonas marginalis pv. marginalis TaxID=97473 RepID=A0A3M4A9X0_PSEMA|nr:hypothetical protein ALQ29_200016 [Pseudomonas marginalis pv. marginalis]